MTKKTDKKTKKEKGKKVKKTKSPKRVKPKKKFNLLSRKNKKRIIFFAILIGFSVWFLWHMPLPTKLGSIDYPVSTKVYDRNDNLLYEIYTDKRRTPVELENLPDHIKQATISIEDKDFYKHYGFSLAGMTRAGYNIIVKQKLQGGSTLTQQLVKNTLLTPERTIRRKIREFSLAMIVEGIYTKDQILEMYLNQIPYGSTAYGIEAASELYFGKSAKDLTLAESALLAGLPAAPTRYSPFGARPELAKGRQETVLRRMVEDGYITQNQADAAKEEEIVYAEPEKLKAPHFVLWVKEQLAEKYGDALVEQGGLRIKTTLDLPLQEFAQQAVATEVAKLKKNNVGNGAAIVTNPDTGEILAMVGSKDYFAEDEDGKVNIILAERQPGSSIKPLNYALGIRDKNITASSPLADVPTCFSVAGQKGYCPRNYSFDFHGATQVRFALGNSYNIPAVRVLALNEIENFIDLATKMGITTWKDPANYGLSLTLGGGDVRPYDMATAFGVFANQGEKASLVSILKVEDWQGKVYEETNPDEIEKEEVLDPAVTYIISHILLDDNARSATFGAGSLLNIRGHPEVSVKTGTSNNLRDNWTIGYTSDVVVVVWVGNNDNTPMGRATSGVSGASPILNKVIKEALDRIESGDLGGKQKDHGWPEEPEGIVGSLVCTTSGNTPDGDKENPGCPTRFEYFLKDAIGARLNSGAMDLQINKETGQLADPDLPPEQIETQNHPFLIDPLGTLVCLDCMIASHSAQIGYPLSLQPAR